jgi:hypothetical protein
MRNCPILTPTLCNPMLSRCQCLMSSPCAHTMGTLCLACKTLEYSTCQVQIASELLQHTCTCLLMCCYKRCWSTFAPCSMVAALSQSQRQPSVEATG